MTFRVTVEGDPVAKARARSGKGHTYTPDHVTAAEAVLGWQYRAVLPPGHVLDPTVAWAVEARFFTKTKRRVDIDNLLKLVLDAGNQIVWRDDMQVIELHVYLVRQDPQPRTEIWMSTL